MSDLQTQFEKAAVEVLELPQRPGFTDVKSRAKYDAWARLRGKSAQWAMGEYIKLVTSLQSAA